MEPRRVLYPSQDEVAHIEGAFSDIAIVIAPDAF